MERPKGYVDTEFLKLIAQALEHAKMNSYLLMELEEGSRVLDVGCGPGTDTIRLASLTGPSGIVIGIDSDPEMIAEADRRAEEAGVNTWVEHTKGEATSLPFGEGIFSACRSERLLQHIPPEATSKVMSEMVRVTESGGRVVVLETDYATGSVYTPEFDIERRLARILPERLVNNGYVARALPQLFAEAGLVEVDIELFPLKVTSYEHFRQVARADHIEAEALNAGIVTGEELDRLRRSLEQADRQGVFFAHFDMVLAAGRKP